MGDNWMRNKYGFLCEFDEVIVECEEWLFEMGRRDADGIME